LGREGDVVKSDLLGEFPDGEFVFRKSVRVGEHYRQRPGSSGVESLQIGTGTVEVERLKDLDGFPTDSSHDPTVNVARLCVLRSLAGIALDDLALFAKDDAVFLVPRVRSETDQSDPLFDLDDLVVQGGRTFDVQIKDPGSRLVPDAQQIFEPAAARVRVERSVSVRPLPSTGQRTTYVINKACFSPFLSNKAFVATVVLSLTKSINKGIKRISELEGNASHPAK
jgi:hypothetical protein